MLTSDVSRVVPPILLVDTLGFPPERLLDDLINCANDSIYRCVSAMETVLSQWADKRATGYPADKSPDEAEIERGLVAFQTLLERHVDMAFDIFDVWSRRNIFAFSLDLPVIVPHQRGLDLLTRPEEEVELFTEIEELRRKVDNQRHLRRYLQRALSIIQADAQRSQKRSEDLGFLLPLLQSDLHDLPSQVMRLYESLKALPLEQPVGTAQPDPRKRLWETSTESYLQWAVKRLVDQARAARRSTSDEPTALSSAVDAAEGIGGSSDIRSALRAMASGDSNDISMSES